MSDWMRCHIVPDGQYELRCTVHDCTALECARAEVEALKLQIDVMKPVVEAAVALENIPSIDRSQHETAELRLWQAVDEYNTFTKKQIEPFAGLPDKDQPKGGQSL